EINYQPNRSIEIICFISEESSRFGISTIGSKAIVGDLEFDKIKDIKDSEGISLGEILKEDSIEDAKRQENDFHSFLELHIEQGPILESAKYSIGIVEGIATPLRYQVHIIGESNHSGTTPMNKRKDAFTVASEIILFIKSLGEENSKRDQFVATTTMCNLFPN